MNHVKMQRSRLLDFKCTFLDASKPVDVDVAATAMNEIIYAVRMVGAKRFLMNTSAYTVEAYDAKEFQLNLPQLDWVGIFKTCREANMDVVQVTSLTNDEDPGDKVAECFLYESPGKPLSPAKGAEQIAATIIVAMLRQDLGRLCMVRDGESVQYICED